MAEQELTLSWEWDATEPSSSPELAATFARLNIRVGDQDVTLVEDRATRSSRRSIYVPLYPLAEWVVFHWWNLLHDSRPNRWTLRRPDPRHSMRSSGDGFLWPDLSLVPEGPLTRVAWRADRTHSPAFPTRYLTSGLAFVEAKIVVRELTNLVETTIARLRETGLKETPLENEWAVLRSLDPDEASFCRAVARMGLDPFGDGLDYEEQVIAAAQALDDPDLVRDFFDSVTATEMRSSLAWVLSGLDRVRRARGADDQPALRLRRAVLESPAHASPEPWRAGWTRASIVRGLLDSSPGSFFDLEPYLSTVALPVEDRELIALGEAGSESSPVVVLGRGRSATSRRFAVARALSRHVSGHSGPFIVSNAYSDVQRVERAFAAELLAPAEGVARLLNVEPENAQQDDIEAVAEHFGVADVVVRHQIENQLLHAS